MGATAQEETVAADESEPRTPGALLERGDLVGRYVVLDRIGSGGMGIVHAAWDPELDRRVAIKLVLGEEGSTEASRGHRRLLREAQALARLSHPNVVTVHDVGELHGRIWLAMELVEGHTLREWATTQRPWSQLLAALVQAGEGLSAAHAAGLVHRDFKPDNVMVAADAGRVLVMDFGLARSADSTIESTDASMPTTADELSTRLTLAGALVGTPKYMAPEQYTGEPVDARADQYAFCTTAWEVLFGEAPFRGDNHASLVLAKTEGRLRVPAAGRRIPAWVRRTLERGLASDPDARWPSMDALLEALRRGRSRRRRRTIVALGGAALTVVLGGLAARTVANERVVDDCTAEANAIATVWPGPDGTRREEVRAAFEATALPDAVGAFDRVAPWLDASSARWRDRALEVCVASRLEHDPDPELTERIGACLDERRDAIALRVDAFAHADRELVHRAVTAAARDAHVDVCSDEQRLRARPRPPADRSEVRALTRRLEESRTLRWAGKPSEALALTQTTVDEAERIGWPPLVTAARYELGIALESTGDAAGSERVLEDAYLGALAVGDDALATSVATHLAQIVGMALARPDDGLAWARHADALFSRAGHHDAMHEAMLETARGLVFHAKGEHEAALQHLERAVALREEAVGPEHPEFAAAVENLAIVSGEHGNYERAIALHERAIALRERLLGAEHPDTAASIDNLALLLAARGSYDEALARHERALAIRERVLGVEHPAVASSCNAIATVHAERGEHARARVGYERALAIWERALGSDHPMLTSVLGNIALVDKAEGKLDDAEQRLQRALRIQLDRHGESHPDVAPTLHNLGEIHLAAGQLDDAERSYARALEIAEATLGPTHIGLAHPLLGLAEVALRRGDAARAHALAERALEIREQAGASGAPIEEARAVVDRAAAAG